MKVCLLNDSFPPVIDGVANVVMNYGRILEEEHLADVLVGTPKYPDTDYSCYPYRVVPYQSFDTTKIVKGYRAGNPLDIKELKDMADFTPDIIHSHCPVSSMVLARLLRSRTDAPLVFTYHTKFDVDIARAVKAKFIQNQTISALVSNIAASDEVWVVSHGAGENLRSLGYDGEYRVVNNGVDFAKGRVEQKLVEEVTAGYDLPKGVPVFLFVGRIIKYKGLPLIIEALKQLDAVGQDYRMIFVGSGPDEDEMKEMATEKCIFTGPIYDRNQLRAWNTRADLFLFPSTYDTNGIVVREAAACGLASVLISGSCAAEGITHGRNGYMVEETPEAMCVLLRKITQDMDRISQVGQNAMDEIYISWEESVHDAYERYGEIIERKQSGRLPSKRQMMMEHFHDFTSDLLDDTREMIALPRRMYDDMRDNVSDLTENVVSQVKENIEEAKGDIKDGLKKLL